ncbi:MAG: flippase [Ignavibacteriae bacterium]|nr:flippase [Ignavibacteria bacterium]MBI3364687.1 flippase [Ignavibacteriota bacterium]
MTPIVKSTGLVLARNTLFNFLTQVGVSVVAFVSIPIIIKHIGEDAFGLLTMAWLVVGYFSILDLGVGQASVKFLAELFARGESDEANTTIWASVGVSVILGLITSLLMSLLIPPILNHLVHVPAELQAEARTSFYIVTIAVPFVMLQGALRAIPAAMQRFDLLNIVQGLSGFLQWGGSLILILLGQGLLGVVILTVSIRVAGALSVYWIAVKIFPGLALQKVKNVRPAISRLLKFGGWLTVAGIVGPVIRYLDRGFVASYYSLKIFTFYSVPCEAISRMQVIPVSVSSTLYPALAERGGSEGSAQSLHVLYYRAIKVMLLIILPVCIVLAVLSRKILQAWLGSEFAAMSSMVFSLLAVAASMQAIAYVPITTLQAIGKPDVAAKFYMAELPIYLLLCFLLIPSYGIEGAALAWLVRSAIITAGLLWITHGFVRSEEEAARLHGLWSGIALNGCVLLAVFTAAYLFDQTLLQAGILVMIAIGYAMGIWCYCFDITERRVLMKLVSRSTG